MKPRLVALLLLAATLVMAKENIMLVNYGPAQSIREGDDDFQQIVFIRVEKSFTDSLYLRIFDLDCGGELDLAFAAWNTQTRVALYGGTGAVSAPSLQDARPTEADRDAGRLLAEAREGENRELNNSWYNLGRFAPADGEMIGDYRYFKLVVQCLSGNDANVFDLRVSASGSMNRTPEAVTLYSFSPTLRLQKDENVASIAFPVPREAKSITIHNFDLAGAAAQCVTAFRSNLAIASSGQGEWAQSIIPLEPLESGRQCAVVLGQGGESPNDVSLYVTDDQKRLLPITLPVQTGKLNRRPVIQKSLIALSDCQSIVFDAKASSDADGDLLDFYWEFGDGTSATGSRVVHSYPDQTTYSALLIVSDNSGEVGNSAFERFNVTVNKPPVARAGIDLVTAPLKVVTFDGSASSDADGKLALWSWDFGDGLSAAGSKTTHSYNRPGTYRAILRVEDNSDSPCNFSTDEIKVWVNAQPVAVAGEDTRGSIGQPLAFAGDKSTDSDGELVAWQWNFGDGGKGDGKFSEHAWTAPGLYRVNLAVTDNAGVDNSTQSDELTVFINDPPVAKAGPDSKGAINEVLTFDGSGSLDRDGALINYTWDMGDGTVKNGKQITHAYAKSGKYTVTLAVQDNSQTNSDTRSDDLVVTINQPPVADAGPDQLVTASEVLFTAAKSSDSDGEIIKYEWNFGDGTTGTGAAPAHVYAKAGTYLGKVTVTDNSGTKNNQASDEIKVVVNEKPLADAGPDQTGAINQEILFDGSGSRDLDGKISDYSWDFGDGQSATGMRVAHTYKRSGKMTARLAVKDNTGQERAVDFDDAIVTINARPVALAGHDRILEPGGLSLFDGSASYDADPDSLGYLWQFSDGLQETAASRVRRSFATPGIYTAILNINDRSGTANATAADTVVIRVNAAPIANAGKNIFSCDKTLLFDGANSADPDSDPLTYTWNFGDGSRPATGVQALHKYDHSGTYPVILTVDDGLGLKNSRHSHAITVKINEAPVADAGPSETYCSGEVIIFNASGSRDPENGLLKYDWDFGDGTTAEGLNPTKIFKNDGAYMVTLTVKDDSGLPCNTDVVTKAIRVIESPIAMAGPDQQVCTNAPVHFDGTASRDFDGVVNNYFWDFGDGITGGGATPTHSYKKAGIYRAVLTITGDLRGDCDNTDTDELIVTVHDAPLAQFACPEVAPVARTIDFDASTSTSAEARISEYLWDFGDGTRATGVRASHSYAKSGKYMVNLTINAPGSSYCNSSTTPKMIIINDAPVAAAGADLTAGINQDLFLNGAASHDPDGTLTDYLWQFEEGQPKSGKIIRHRFAKPGRHRVILTVTDQTAAANNSDSDTLQVLVNDPVVPVISASPAGPCPGQSVTFSAAGSRQTGGKTITCRWNFGDGQSATGTQVSHSFASGGRYHVTLMIDDGLALDNSISDTTMVLDINHQPVAAAGGDRVTCPGAEVRFDASASYDADETGWTVEWDLGDGTSAKEKMVAHRYDKAGLYTVRLRVTDHSGGSCATAEDIAIVRVNAAPVAAAGPDRKVYFGGAHDAVLFDGTASSDADGDGLTYAWDFGDGTTASGARVYHAYEKPGIYAVKLVVDDGRKTPCSRMQDEAVITVINRD